MEGLLGDLKAELLKGGADAGGLPEIVDVTAALSGSTLGNDLLQEVIGQSRHNSLCWRTLQSLVRVSRDPTNLPAQDRERVQALVADLQLQEWILDVADGTRLAPPPGRSGRPAKTWRNLLVVHTIFELGKLGVDLMEACRLVGKTIHMSDVYRDIWRRRDQANDEFHEGGNNSLK